MSRAFFLLYSVFFCFNNAWGFWVTHRHYSTLTFWLKYKLLPKGYCCCGLAASEHSLEDEASGRSQGNREKDTKTTFGIDCGKKEKEIGNDNKMCLPLFCSRAWELRVTSIISVLRYDVGLYLCFWLSSNQQRLDLEDVGGYLASYSIHLRSAVPSHSKIALIGL